MDSISLKLILIVIIAIAIGGVGGYLISKNFQKAKAYIPSLVYSKITPTQFFEVFYSKAENQFKMTKASPPSLEATYYALSTIKKGLRAGFGQEIEGDVDKIFEKVRAYYNADFGYYVGAGGDPIASTQMALSLATYYPQKLNQDIDINWLEGNSLDNEALAEEKFDPEYQLNVLGIYKGINSESTKAKLQEMGPKYLNYYCDYEISGVSDSEYLRRKYHQIAIISYLSGADNLSSGTCLKAGSVENDKERLKTISYGKLSDIKDLFRLYFLRKFYNVENNQNEAYANLEKFYFEKEFKENTRDESPNIVGMYYGAMLYSLIFGHSL